MPKLTPRLAALLLITGAALAEPAPAKADDTPRVVAVNYALSYFAERLGAGDVAVEFPVPDGTDPSFWRPGVSEISAVQSADLILLNGAGFSTWTTKASLPRSRIVNTSRSFSDRYIRTETVTHSHGTDGEHSHSAVASYTWLDQELAILQAEAIAGALAARELTDPQATYDGLEGLKQDLSGLDAAATELGALAEGQVLIATHPRYQYFAEAYGLDIRSMEWEAGIAPDDGQLAELATMIDDTGATLLLWEKAPPENARAAVRDLGVAEMVFPTLAQRPAGADYTEQLRTSISELSGLLSRLGQ